MTRRLLALTAVAAFVASACSMLPSGKLSCCVNAAVTKNMSEASAAPVPADW